MLRLDINLVFTIINILILYFLLKFLLFKPVRKILAEREAEIRKSYADADKVSKDADELKAQYEKTLQSVDADKAKALNEARSQANAEYDRILSEANAKSSQILSEASTRAAAAATQQKQKAEAEIADMARQAAARIAAAESDDKLYDSFLQQVENPDAENVTNE